MTYVICEQQRRRSACVSVQSDQCLCFLCLDSIISVDSIAEISVLASVAAQAGLCLVGNVLRHVLLCCGSYGSKDNCNCHMYRKFPKYLDTQNICCNHSKIWAIWLYHRVMSPNDIDRMANSVDPDQTAVWSGSALFAQAYLSENLGSL